MRDHSLLTNAFESYLRSGMESNPANRLAAELTAVGLLDEAGALLCQHRDGRTEYVCQREPWQGRTCTVSEKLCDRISRWRSRPNR